jgi:hypothetical protein
VAIRKADAFGVAAFAHQVQHLLGGVRIQAGGGLVGNHQAGRFDQRPGDRHTLALAAGQGVRPVCGVLGQAHRLQHGLHPLAALGGGHAGKKQRVVHVVGHRHHRHQVEALEDEADGVAAQQRGLGLVQPGDVAAAKEDAPASARSISPARFNRVLLPLPEGPVSASISLARSCRSTPCKAGTMCSPRR